MSEPLKPGTLVEFVGLPTHYFNQPYGFSLSSISDWKIDHLFGNLNGTGMIVEVCPDPIYAKNMIPNLEKDIGSKEYYLYKVLVNYKTNKIADSQALIAIYSFFVRLLNNSV